MTADGARVLVVDDEPAICRTLKTNLARHGFQVSTEANGAGAVDALDSWRPDIILLDLGLPDMDGIDVIREVRKRGNTPVIVLSVRETEHDKVAALDLGADDYLRSPSASTSCSPASASACVTPLAQHQAPNRSFAAASSRSISNVAASPSREGRCT